MGVNLQEVREKKTDLGRTKTGMLYFISFVRTTETPYSEFSPL